MTKKAGSATSRCGIVCFYRKLSTLPQGVRMVCRALFPFAAFVGGLVCGIFLALTLFVSQDPPVLKQYTADIRVSPKRQVFDLANLESRKYLFPEYVPRRKRIPLEHPALLRQEYTFRKTVFVGMLSSEMYLPTRAKAIYDTWGSEVSMLVFFVGEDCNVPADLAHLPVIKLKGIPDHVYPPLRKAFAVMQYMYDHFVDDYNWFIRADDDMYLRGNELIRLLNQMDSNDVISLGRAGEGKEEDMPRLRLINHERYCMGGPGMIFSRGAMKGLGPYLDLCLNAIFYHDQRNPQKWNDDDVEIGRCLSRELDVQCSTSREGRRYFHYDFTGDSLNPAAFWTKAEFWDMITIHPVKDPDHIHSLHLFYKTLEYEGLFEQHEQTKKTITHLCKNLPHNLVPPSFIDAGCNIDFTSSHYYDQHNLPENRQVHKHHQRSSY